MKQISRKQQLKKYDKFLLDYLRDDDSRKVLVHDDGISLWASEEHVIIRYRREDFPFADQYCLERAELAKFITNIETEDSAEIRHFYKTQADGKNITIAVLSNKSESIKVNQDYLKLFDPTEPGYYINDNKLVIWNELGLAGIITGIRD